MEVILGAIGGLDARMEADGPAPCGAMGASCNAVSVCFAVEMAPTTLLGVE